MPNLTRKLLAAAAPIALLMLSACDQSFHADVSRFQAMPAPAGQSFTIQTSNPRLQGGLEFSQYASLVAQRLTAVGYHAAEVPQSATLVVNLDYGVDNGQQKIVSTPGYSGFGYGWGPGWGPGWGGRHGYRSSFYWGWDDPFWYRPWGYPEVDSYTVFTSHLDMTINRTADGQRLFEGKAKARSTTDDLTKLVPNLVDAMFTNFPGRSGEEVHITVPPPTKK
jgi:hypothetical protein